MVGWYWEKKRAGVLGQIPSTSIMDHEEQHRCDMEKPQHRMLFGQKLAGDATAAAVSALLITPPVQFIDQ
jgi:hypothetical protein